MGYHAERSMLRKLLPDRKCVTLLGAAIAIYLTWAFAIARTKIPWNDEAWFGAPAYNLYAHGSMGTPNLDPTGSWLAADLPGIREHSYWIMPFHPVLQAAWYRIFGPSLLSLRALSIAWGLVTLLAWFVIGALLTELPALAAFGSLILSLDYTFIWGAADGRCDMMCLALGSAGMALYLLLRETNLTRAILVANCLVAAAFLTHPNGLWMFAGLAFLVIYFDWRRLRWREVMAGAPYLLAGVIWALYILQAPADFMHQFAANAGARGGARWTMFLHPWQNLWLEFLFRYVGHFAAMPLWTGYAKQSHILIPMVYIGALLSTLLFPRIRSHPGRRAAVCLAFVLFLMSAFSGLKLQSYLIFVIPGYTLVLVMWIRCATRTAAALVVIVIIGIFSFFQVSTLVHRVRENGYAKAYVPVVDFVKSHSSPFTVVMGPSIMGFGLGYSNLIDDARFGYISGKLPDFIVTDRFYAAFHSVFAGEQPEVWRHIDRTLKSDFRLVFERGYFKVYARAESL